jgi:hypothetical protein
LESNEKGHSGVEAMNYLWDSLQILAEGTYGWFFLAASFAIPLLSPRFRRDQAAFLAACLTIFFHAAGAITQCYLMDLPSTYGDARGFNTAAVELATLGVTKVYTEEPFSRFLGAVYSFCGATEFVGCALAVLAYSLSLIPFLEIAQWLLPSQGRVRLILLYGLLPAKVMYCCVTLRESYQALSFLTGVWCLCRLRQNPKEVTPYLGLALSVQTLGYLHNGLGVYAAGLGVLGIVWAWGLLGWRSISVVMLAVLLLALPGGPVTELLAEFDASQNLERVESYREHSEIGRANYGLKLDTHSVQGIVTTPLLALVYYMFVPFPWQVNGLNDLYGLLESFFRFGLVGASILAFRGMDKSARAKFLFISAAFLSLEFLWSIGSSNWGQAIRHRCVAWGLLVLLGGLPLSDLILPRKKSPVMDAGPAAK